MERVYQSLRAILEDGAARGGEGAGLLSGVIRALDWSRSPSLQTPRPKPVAEAHLEAALALAPDGVAGDFAAALGAVADQLRWCDCYDAYAGEPDMDALRRDYAYVHFAGLDGMIESPTALISISLQGPHTFYPSHVHKAPEVYFVAAGVAEWQRGDGPWSRKPPGGFLYHPSGARHATRTFEQPLLSVVVWLGDLGSGIVIVRE